MQLRLGAKQVFFGCAMLLTIIGILFVYSASDYWGKVHYVDQTPFYVKQLIYACAALLLFFAIVRSKVKFTLKTVFWIYLVSIVLLILVLVPGIGLLRNGSRSWIGIGGLTIQPAEMAKLATLLYLSKVIADRPSGKSIMQWRHLIIIVIPTVLIMLQPDFGAVFLLVVTSLFLLFISRYPIKIFMIILAVGTGLLTALIISAPYRLKRITAFLNPWEDPLNSGFQAVQSLLAIGPAGFFGHGFLKSRQKYLYLPEPQNDFIFSIILEEMGFIGGFVLVLIFACFLASGFYLAKKSKERSVFYMISSLTALIGIQTILNMGVVVGLFPVTGVTLPFISYGGTSLLFVWIAVAIILKLANIENRRR